MRRSRLHRHRRLTPVLLLLVAAGSSQRLAASEAERITEVLALAPGQQVADVGAGDGEWTEVLAREVGEGGRVWTTEVEIDKVDRLRDDLAAAGFANVTAVLGDQQDLGLPESCCDAVLLRLVYHHFTDPAPMRAGLHRALRPGGRLAVIEIEPQTHWRDLPGVPDRGGHGIPRKELVRELTAAGFRVVEQHDDWPGDEDHYCVVFESP